MAAPVARALRPPSARTLLSCPRPPLGRPPACSKAEKAGFSLSKIEKLGLLSTAERLGLLSLADELLVTDPGKVRRPLPALRLPFPAAASAARGAGSLCLAVGARGGCLPPFPSLQRSSGLWTYESPSLQRAHSPRPHAHPRPLLLPLCSLFFGAQITSASIPFFLGAVISLVLIPQDNLIETALAYTLALVFGGAATTLFVGGFVLKGLQDE